MKVINPGKKAILTATILACCASSISYASEWHEEPADSSVVNYKEGHWGMGTGAVTGAAVGGPPGFLVGALLGKLYGREQGMQNSIQQRDEQLQQLQSQIKNKDNTIATLESSKEKQGLQVASLVNTPMSAAPQFEQLIQQGIAFTIHFKTDSDQIEEHLVKHCRALTQLVKLSPSLKVNLQGFADARGEASYNLTLAQRRVQAVKDLLVQEGIAEDAIIVSAKGEQDLLDLGNDHDSLSFDRRVVITFSQAEERS